MLKVVGFFVGLAAAATAGAQTVATDPLQCWWRTSAGAVRVGEPFSVVLTCAVLETSTIKVVPDQAPLDPTVMQIPPFEVLGGAHSADLRTDDRRFFQYEYRLRVIGEDLFGKDVKVPEMKVAYRIQTGVGGAAIEGREQTYFLPPLSVRVLSLVPADATDIRDATAETFGNVETRFFRANTLRTLGGVFFALAALTLILAAARLIVRYRKPGVEAERLVRDTRILAALRDELAAVRRERQETGWTAALAGRLAAALRIAGGYALSPPAIHVAAAGPNGHEGDLLIRGRWTSGTTAAVSSSVTTLTLARERSRMASANGLPQAGTRGELVEELERALRHVTVARYGRERALDETSLDEALETGLHAVRRLRINFAWPVKKIAALGRFGSEVGQRVWIR